MAGPNRTFFRDIPITSFSGWSRVYEIEGILAEHDRGRFTRSAMLCDAMMRDDRIAGVMDTRIGALLASPVEAKPANQKRKATQLAKQLCGDDVNDGCWDEVFPAPIIRGMTKWGNLLGVSVAEILWQTGPDNWMPRLKLWHPQFVWWNWAEQRYMLTTADGIVPLPRIEDSPQSDGKWVVWAPRGYRYGWFDALVRRLAHKYIMRGWDYRDWAGYNERHGNPIIGAQTPAQANEESKTSFVMALANMGSESTIELPTGEEGNRYDLKLIEAKSRSWQSFQEFKNEIDSDIAIAVLGQDMTTQSKAAGIGGGAQAQVHQDVALDRRREDAALANCLRQQVLSWWCKYNQNDTELAPIVSYQVDPPEDENAEAAALKGLGDAITSLKTATDNAVDVRAICDEWGVPLLSEEEVAANKQKAMEEAQAQMEAQGGLPGAGGIPPKPGAPPVGGGAIPPKKPAPPMAKQPPQMARASMAVDETAALEALVARVDGAALRNSRTAKGQRRAKLYSDRVAASAVKMASRALSSDLVGLTADINAAEDFDDLKARIIHRYKGMDPGALAEIVRKANLLAHLGGRVTAIKQL